MIKTFRETLRSLKDPDYARIIVSQTPKSALWYWLRYLILFAIIPAIAAVGALTYFTPQFPRLLRNNLPGFNLAVKNGQASSSLAQPYVLGNQDFAFILNTAGKPSDLDHFRSGILVLKTQILAKSTDNHIDSRQVKDLGDFTASTEGLASWLSSNQYLVLFTGMLLILVLGTLIVLFYASFQILTFFLWGLGFWLAGKVFKRTLAYWDCFKIVVYASVLPLIISAITAISPNPIIDYLNIGLFAFYAITWFRYLTKPRK